MSNTIEFSQNAAKNWFIVMYDDTIINSIKDIASKFKVQCTKAFNYTRPENRWVMYFNTNQLPVDFIKEVKSKFKVSNTSPKEAAARIDRGIQLELADRRNRIWLNKFEVLDIKHAMVKVIGPAAQIKSAFADHGFKLTGHATKRQCIELIIKLAIADQILALLRTPVETVTPDVLPVDAPDFWETVEVSESDNIELSMTEMETIVKALCQHQLSGLLVAGRDHAPEFEPWTFDELFDYTVDGLKDLAKLDGIDLTGKSRLRKADFIKYVMPLLNQAGAEQHANG